MKIKEHKEVNEYQCPGCVCGSSTDDGCFKEADGKSISCQKHCAGTMAMPVVGRFFLGMPKGFNRIGTQKDLKIEIFKTQAEQEAQWVYNEYNVPVWKHKNKAGHIFIRGYMPRINEGFIHIILKGDYDKIKAFEIDIKSID